MKISLGVGDHVKDVRCPKCDRATVVYNGNYFCADEDNCGWAMAERAKTKKGRQRDKHIISEYLNQRFEEAELEGDQPTMDAMRFYMDRL